MVNCKTCEFQYVCAMPDFVRNDLKLCRNYKQKKPQTNADRIRAMSDEELAKITIELDVEYGRYICSDGTEYAIYCKKEAIQHEIEWLKSEAKE